MIVGAVNFCFHLILSKDSPLDAAKNENRTEVITLLEEFLTSSSEKAKM